MPRAAGLFFSGASGSAPEVMTNAVDVAGAEIRCFMSKDVDAAGETVPGEIIEGNGAAGARVRRRLHKKDKLRFKSQFDQMKRDGEKLVGPALLVVISPSPSGRIECGVICGKKYSLLAVRRNRARRLLWESFRLLRGEIAEPVRVLLIPRRRLGDYSRQQATRELAMLLARRGIILPEVAVSPPEC